jgi:peroxiredoxin
LADGSAAFTKALGMEMDLDGFGMGVRCKRFAMIVKNGTVDALYVENSAGECGVSHADQVLAIL